MAIGNRNATHPRADAGSEQSVASHALDRYDSPDTPSDASDDGATQDFVAGIQYFSSIDQDGLPIVMECVTTVDGYRIWSSPMTPRHLTREQIRAVVAEVIAEVRARDATAGASQLTQPPHSHAQ